MQLLLQTSDGAFVTVDKALAPFLFTAANDRLPIEPPMTTNERHDHR